MEEDVKQRVNTPWSGISPTQLLVSGYLLILFVGTFLLRLPSATIAGRLSLVDAFFMASSALCVTGLSVVSIGTELTLFGQLIILALVQVGAIGIMTISSLFALLLGRRIGLRNRLVIQEDLNISYLSGAVRLIRSVIGITLIVEFAGAFLLFLRLHTLMPRAKAVYYSMFHSVSAFANAGFDLFGDSLESLGQDWVVLLTIATLFIVGGLGFSVIYEVLHLKESRRFSLHARMVLLSTGTLILGSFLVLFLLESANPQTLEELSFGTKLIQSFFTAVTARTAGFHVIPTASLTHASLFFLLFLMFVGASPSSTGGGIKTTTFVTLLLGVRRTIAGKKDVQVLNRRIDDRLVAKALAITLIAFLWVLFVSFILLIVEDFPLLDSLFEVVSAFGTVGLSMGITAELSSFSRVLLALTMFLGRIGPMTLALAIGKRSANGSYGRLPEEKISLG